MLINAKQILVSELTLAENSQKEQIEEEVETKINQSFEEYNGTEGNITEENGTVNKLIKF